jgi:hypothetical protein
MSNAEELENIRRKKEDEMDIIATCGGAMRKENDINIQSTAQWDDYT